MLIKGGGGSHSLYKAIQGMCKKIWVFPEFWYKFGCVFNMAVFLNFWRVRSVVFFFDMVVFGYVYSRKLLFSSSVSSGILFEAISAHLES